MRIQVRNFNLRYTLECGQFFRYTPHGDGYIVQVRDSVLWLAQHKDALTVKGSSRAYVRRLLRLDDDIHAIEQALSGDMTIIRLMRQYPGLRLMRQDPWECLVSYVCSAAANIPKIRGNIQALAQAFGKPIKYNGETHYTFPPPGSLSCAETIRACKTGYRTPYVCRINEMVNDAALRRIGKLPYEQAVERLMQLPGVGRKIADCVLLFSLDHDEAFPIDTRIRGIMRKLYFRNKTVSDSRIRQFAEQRFGAYAGYAQQYLYVYAGQR